MTTTHLFRGNERGEILDADGKVVGRIVPPEPTKDMHTAGAEFEADSYVYEEPPDVSAIYTAMLSAAPTDWSKHAVRVPERIVPAPSFEHVRLLDRDKGWNACLDAIKGAK